LQEGVKVGNGDICIPLVDLSWHNQLPNPFKDYVWNGHAMGMMTETLTHEIDALCPGLDCAINCRIELVNVEKATPAYDDGGLHRSRDAGVGAFSPYHNGTTLVTRKIPVGGELFKFYGDHWFLAREHIFDKSFPLSKDYIDAQKLLETMWNLTDNEAVRKDLVEDVMMKAKARYSSRLLNAFPDTVDKARIAAEAGELAVLFQPAAIRSPAWLKEHGKCVDNIKPGKSTLPQAGRGAFATRFLPKGSTVTASPLHHIVDKSFMNLYNITPELASDGKPYTTPVRWLRHKDQVVGHQLVLNYCMGHPETSLLLCPYGAGVNYINHASEGQANVRLEWATDFPIIHNHDLVTSGTIEQDLYASTRPRLAFNYVAVRDIQPGEELFLFYGDLWEEAWQVHLQDYPHDTSIPKYSSSQRWNEMFQNVPVRTEKEQEVDPYPDNLQIRCHRNLIKKRKDQLGRLDLDFEWNFRIDFGVACRVVDRFWEGDKELYTVIMEWRADAAVNEDEDWDVEVDFDIQRTGGYARGMFSHVTWIERTDVPRSGIAFFDKAGTTDLHLPSAFRHEIQIPGDLLPDQWRNLREEEA
jgi:hypothetical protein